MTVLDLQISVDDRDGFDNGTSFSSAAWNDHLNLVGKDGGGNPINGGLCWLNVTIPQGATIDAASFDVFEEWGGDYGTFIQSKIYGVKTANLAIFSSSNLPVNAPRTTAFIDWDSTDGNMGSNWYSATVNAPPDIKDIIQEIVNQAGWQSGNALGLIFLDDGGFDDWWFEVAAYELGASTAAKLHIEYTAGVTVTPAAVTVKGAAVNPTVELKLDISPASATVKGASVDPAVAMVLELTASAAFARAIVAGPIVIGGGAINPLGEGDSPGFLAFLVASSIFQNLEAAGIDTGLDAPDESNSASWENYLFS